VALCVRNRSEIVLLPWNLPVSERLPAAALSTIAITRLDAFSVR